MTSEKRSGLATSQFDLEKRYDVYQCISHEERVYENVKLIGFRTLENNADIAGLFGKFLEIESIFGSRITIAFHGVHMICEHGTKPMFKVYRSWVEYT